MPFSTQAQGIPTTNITEPSKEIEKLPAEGSYNQNILFIQLDLKFHF